MRVLIVLACFAAAAVLGGCGGGGGGGGGGLAAAASSSQAPVSETSQPPTGGTPSVPVTEPPSGPPTLGPGFAYTYKTVPHAVFSATAAADLLPLLNLPENAGFIYVGSTSDGQNAVLRKGNVPAYAFELGTDMIQEGLRGYVQYAGFLNGPTLYGKPTSEPAGLIYGYAVLNLGTIPPTPADQVLARLNTLGQVGGCLTLSDPIYGALVRGRVEPSPAICTFEAMRLPASADEYLSLLNSQGARGFAHAFTSFGDSFWFKDMTQQVRYDYYIVDRPATDVQTLAQMTQEGAKGALPWSSTYYPGKVIYRLVTNCTRPWICGGG